MIWERYLYKELLKSFLLILFLIFSLHSVIDFSTHMQKFGIGLFLYYGSHFLKYLHLLFPLSLLIGTIKVLSTASAYRELISLQVAGVSNLRLLRPFMIFSLLTASIVLFNYQYSLPKALSHLEIYSVRESKKAAKEKIHVISLKDHSKLIYQDLDKEKNAFYDVIWVRTLDDIWKMRWLDATPKSPTGYFADHLLRNSAGQLEKKESYAKCRFDQLRWKEILPRGGKVPIDHRSISTLIDTFFNKSNPIHHEKEALLTHLLYKSLMPWISPLAIMILSTFCLSYRRNMGVLKIYTFAIFGFVFFATLLDCGVILGENRVVSPLISLLIPFLLLFWYAYRSYRSLQHATQKIRKAT